MDDQDLPRAKGRRRYNLHGRRRNRLTVELRRDRARQAELFSGTIPKHRLTREWQLFSRPKAPPENP